MSYRPSWDSGDWLAICDACGRKYKASTLRKRWDGLMVCHQDWETRQPQDFVRGVADYQAPAYTRPECEDVFVGDGCTVNGRSGIAAYAIAGCSVAGRTYIVLLGDEQLLLDLFPAIAGIAVPGYSIAGDPMSEDPDV